MHYTPILVSLGLTPNEALKDQVRRCVEDNGLSVPDLDKLAALNDEIKIYHGYVALSNSEDVFKIKCDSSDPTMLKDFNVTVYNWAQDNNFKLKKIDGKEVYYLTGKDE
ncbi:hypothetical protein CINF_1384 [Candidatus Campylobacter infans]|uniref:Type II secretion system protein n=1 Tax=Candidatus Campylobacter infans TaxID=2561898 RepID=A0A7H9CM34_9BACT|nr:type II secretion system protein [Candidatus Campylobacter infans]KAF0591169.1 MAG: hypothetical protein CGEMS_0137 [Candidatus Campylobacter infans]QLI05869.1 hypothetical protein CINF_1384 [Candidatus Campylobacter infans]